MNQIQKSAIGCCVLVLGLTVAGDVAAGRLKPELLLKAEYDRQQAHLSSLHKMRRDDIEFAKREALAAWREQKHLAVHELCGKERADAIRILMADRSVIMKQYRADLLADRSAYQLQSQQLRAEYQRQLAELRKCEPPGRAMTSLRIQVPFFSFSQTIVPRAPVILGAPSDGAAPQYPQAIPPRQNSTRPDLQNTPWGHDEAWPSNQAAPIRKNFSAVEPTPATPQALPGNEMVDEVQPPFEPIPQPLPIPSSMGPTQRPAIHTQPSNPAPPLFHLDSQP